MTSSSIKKPVHGTDIGNESFCAKYAREYGKLLDANPGIWIIYALKFLESYAYFALSYIQVLFLTEDFGFTDKEASWIYGIQGMLHFFYSLVFGFVIDNLGVKTSLILGNILMVIARFTLVYTEDRFILQLMLYVVLPMGTSMGIPVMAIAIRRYTSMENRHIAYDLFYICLNFAAAVAAPAIDGVRVLYVQPEGGLSSYRFLILTGAISTLIAFIVCLFLPPFDRPLEPKKASPWTIIKEIAPLPKFRRYALLICLMTGLKMTFRHLDATFPKYMVREFGSDVLFGTVIGLQPLIIIIGLTVVAPLLVKYDTYDLIAVGAFFTGAAPFVLTIVERSFSMTIVFIVVLSVGEILWSPRLYEYANNIADEGREGTYTALANLPMFAATLFSGEMSGWLLTDYCPKFGQCNGRMVWGIIGAFSLTSPILIAMLKPCIYNKADLESNEGVVDKIYHGVEKEPLSATAEVEVIEKDNELKED